MKPALWLFPVELKVKAETTIDVHEGTPVPLLSYKRSGKIISALDALSRHPAVFPTEDNNILADISVKHAIALRIMHTLTKHQEHCSSADLKMEELVQTPQFDDMY
ncbi:hypothetical protein E2C01_031459 [Portunus trituberculatus]|uniref:Uncharacterized protein n=1 Tax=Portunus trituberculatus TaxID=210409 RepID=A0A5B7EYM0_PORTR|nr:hypothetical protein [Portunus trituberculatus]